MGIAVGETYARTFRLVFGNLGTYLRTQGILILASAAFSLVVSLLLMAPLQARMFAAMAEGDMAAMAAASSQINVVSFLDTAVTFVLGTFALGVGVFVTNRLIDGKTTTFQEAFGAARARFGNLLGTFLLLGLLFAGVMLAAGVVLLVPVVVAAFVLRGTMPASLFLMGALAFVAVGMLVALAYVAARWHLALVASMLENASATSNLSRASRLTEGSRGPIALLWGGLYLLLLVPLSVVILPLVVPFVRLAAEGSAEGAQVEAMMPGVATYLMTGVGSAVVGLFAGFLFSALAVILYRRLALSNLTVVSTRPAAPVTDDAGALP